MQGPRGEQRRSPLKTLFFPESRCEQRRLFSPGCSFQGVTRVGRLSGQSPRPPYRFFVLEIRTSADWERSPRPRSFLSLLSLARGTDSQERTPGPSPAGPCKGWRERITGEMKTPILKPRNLTLYSFPLQRMCTVR